MQDTCLFYSAPNNTNKQANLCKSVVAELVHEAVLHGRCHVCTRRVIDATSQIITFLHVAIHTTADSNHPQEFVDVVAAVS